VNGTPNSCVAVNCTPGEIKECRGDEAFTCTTGGNGYELVACDLGCAPTANPHCKYLQPKYLPDVCDVRSTQALLNFTNSGSFDPNLDVNCTGGIVLQAGGPALCVVHAISISIAQGSTVTVVGAETALSRGLAFVADNDLEIAGTLDIGAKRSFNGPGGGTSSIEHSPTSDGNAGGGAGGSTDGGAGGNNTTDGGAANGGVASMNPALLTALVGGQAASRIASFTPDVADTQQSGGGGALSLISCRGAVTVSGTVTAGGGGGLPGYKLGSFLIPGSGGGAGGNVVVQGSRISVTGSFFANGGGGGGGVQNTGAPGVYGADGSLSDTSGASGGPRQNGEGAGGTGGYVNSPPTNGLHPGANAAAGGGGGSMGFLQTLTPAGHVPTLTPSHVSPIFQPNGVVETR
jgi:hypothetical protein